MERDIKFTPEEALAFLAKYAGPITVGLGLAKKTAESRLFELTVDGPEKFGPDDLDQLVKMARKNVEDSVEAAREFAAMTPLKDTSELREFGDFMARYLGADPKHGKPKFPEEDA